MMILALHVARSSLARRAMNNAVLGVSPITQFSLFLGREIIAWVTAETRIRKNLHYFGRKHTDLFGVNMNTKRALHSRPQQYY